MSEGFYPQIPQIVADYGGLSCRCAAIHAAGFFRRLGQILADCCCLTRMSEGFFIRRFRRLSQIMAACLAAARQFTPPVFFADWGRLTQIAVGGLFFWEGGS
jgi:hypothetical protein